MAAALATLCVAGSTGACGSEPEEEPIAGTVSVRDPARAFAPMVRLHRREQWLPMSVDDFLAESVLWFAGARNCSDRKVAVGRGLEEQRTEEHDWIYPEALGHSPAYSRYAYDRTCDEDFGREYFANQRTRPHDREGRPAGLRLDEGFYLELEDRARRPVRPMTEAYFDLRPEEIDGEDGLRLSYWILFGMNQPLGRSGHPIERLTHEGDWERLDVLVQRGNGAHEYLPVALHVHRDGDVRRLAWSRVERSAHTHPVVRAHRGDHRLAPAQPCANCMYWATWEELTDARKEPWYGFGGAWGDIGPTVATTGPIGPHLRWSDGE